MRYWLLFYEEKYFILSRSQTGILFQALSLVSKPLASVTANSYEVAFRHLYTIALIHHRKSILQNRDKHTDPQL